MDEDSAGGGDLAEQLSSIIFKNITFAMKCSFPLLEYMGVASLKSQRVECCWLKNVTKLIPVLEFTFQLGCEIDILCCLCCLETMYGNLDVSLLEHHLLVAV